GMRNGGIGTGGKIGQRFLERGPTGEIPPGDPDEIVPSPVAQFRHPVRFELVSLCIRGAQRKISARQRPLEVMRVNEPGKKSRIAIAGVCDEITRSPNGGERIVNRGAQFQTLPPRSWSDVAS